jgi:hypothetical protein
MDHILIDRRWHSSIPGVRRFRGADCDTDHYLVVVEVRERLEVCKQTAQAFVGERSNLSGVSEMRVRKQYQFRITNRFAALENLSGNQNINRAWENVKVNF